MYPLVTIIVPVYNSEKHLNKCVDSILAQIYQNLEVILVDDGSTDKSANICDLYAQRDPRVVTIHQKNSGQSAARNNALDLAKGDYIAFVDSDDCISSNYISNLYQAAIKDDADIAVCDYCIVDEEGKTTIKRSLCKSGTIRKEKYYEMETTNDYMFCIALWNKLFRSSLWSKLRLKVDMYAEDSFAMTKYIKAANAITVIHEPLYYYYQHSDSLVHSFSVKNLDSVEARFERIKLYHSLGKVEWEKSSLYYAMEIMAIAYEKLDLSDKKNRERYMQLRVRYIKLFDRISKSYGFNKKEIKCYIYARSDKLYHFITHVLRKFRMTT